MTTHLWALAGALPADPTAQDTLSTTLTHHAQVTSLLLVRAVRDAQARSYLATEGCAGCLHEHCEVGCRTDLLRRSLRATSGQVRLRHIRLGLTSRPYGHRWLAWPTKQTLPPTIHLLDGMQDARLLLHWQPPLLPRQPPTLCALLLAGDDDADGATRLREQGWQVVAVPRLLPWYRATQGMPPALPPGRTPPFAPLPLLPDTSAPSDPPAAATTAHGHVAGGANGRSAAAAHGHTPAATSTRDETGVTRALPVVAPVAAAALPHNGSQTATAPRPPSNPTWEPLPDPLVDVLAEVEQETDAAAHAAPSSDAAPAADAEDTQAAPAPMDDEEHTAPEPAPLVEVEEGNEAAPAPLSDVESAEPPAAEPDAAVGAEEPPGALLEPEPAPDADMDAPDDAPLLPPVDDAAPDAVVAAEALPEPPAEQEPAPPAEHLEPEPAQEQETTSPPASVPAGGTRPPRPPARPPAPPKRPTPKGDA
jgi:hypothetical protein